MLGIAKLVILYGLIVSQNVKYVMELWQNTADYGYSVMKCFVPSGLRYLEDDCKE